MIEIKDLNKIYNKNKSNEFHALHDVTLTIDDGEMVAVMGRSGAGKSTLMHIIGCIDYFESGEYILDGVNVADMGQKGLAQLRNSKIGIVMQDFALIDDYTVLENVMVPLYFSKCKMNTMRATAMDCIRKVGMEDQAKKPVSRLSGGQKQRAAIARAMVNNPSVLLADEPTGALDTKTSSEIMELFTDLNKEGRTIVIITHDKDVALKCKRTVVIEDGRIA